MSDYKKPEWDLFIPNALPGDPAITEQFPEHMKLVGNLVSEWSQVEHKLVVLLSYLMSADAEIIRPMLYAIESSSARLDAIRAALLVLLHGNDQWLEVLTPLMDKAGSLLAQRNKYGHALYGMTGKGELGFVRVSKNQVTAVPLHDLEHQFGRMKELAGEIGALIPAAMNKGKLRRQALDASAVPQTGSRSLTGAPAPEDPTPQAEY